ncbi:MAG: shikimate dehydrogenase [Bacteroidales bacterium]|nr:shikimate dehydrogenase [Bacteroidales bacterium]
MNRQKKIFGLIGNPVKHSFSQIYFEEKFRLLNLNGFEYKLFELKSVTEIGKLLKNEPCLQGLNVTSPFKTEILQYIDVKSDLTAMTGSCNCIKIKDNQLYGYNTDVFGFLKALKEQTDVTKIHSALILGSGGAAKAVKNALENIHIQILCVSRNPIGKDSKTVSYKDLSDGENLDMFDLIVNATPCGMKHTKAVMQFPYEKINAKHTVFDLVYNPPQTELLIQAAKRGAKTINGLKMLYYQADKSWEIWTKEDN